MKVHQYLNPSGESPLHIVVSGSTPSAPTGQIHFLMYSGASNGLLEQRIDYPLAPLERKGENSTLSITPLPVYHPAGGSEDEFLTLGAMIDDSWVEEVDDADSDKTPDYEAILSGEYVGGSLEADLRLYFGQNSTDDEGNYSALKLPSALMYLLDSEDTEADTPPPYAPRNEDGSSYYAFDTSEADSAGNFEGDESATALKTSPVKAEDEEAEENSGERKEAPGRERPHSLDQLVLRAA